MKKNTRSLPKPGGKPVLFICTANYYRSRFAQEVFNHEASRRKMDVRAISRGILPFTPFFAAMHPHTRKALEERGIEFKRTVPLPVQLKVADLENARLAIALCEREHRPMMEELFPAWAGQITYWHFDDVDQNFPEIILPAIEKQVIELLDNWK